MPRLLVACEMSGRVRTAFAKRGWDAWSCDLLPDESHLWNVTPGWILNDGRYGKHYQGDVRDLLDEDWDLVIAHPPCTDLSQAGARYWAQKQADGRQAAAAQFFQELYARPRPEAYVAVENPRGVMSRVFRQPDQVVEPCWFGDPFSKKTCLWYRESRVQPKFCRGWVTDRLPDLQPSNAVQATKRLVSGGSQAKRYGGKNPDGTALNSWEDSQGRARRHILRSITLPGFADAMAEQWGSYVEQRRGQ
jgi:hypothetical protein